MQQVARRRPHHSQKDGEKKPNENAATIHPIQHSNSIVINVFECIQSLSTLYCFFVSFCRSKNVCMLSNHYSVLFFSVVAGWCSNDNSRAKSSFHFCVCASRGEKENVCSSSPWPHPVPQNENKIHFSCQNVNELDAARWWATDDGMWISEEQIKNRELGAHCHKIQNGLVFVWLFFFVFCLLTVIELYLDAVRRLVPSFVFDIGYVVFCCCCCSAVSHSLHRLYSFFPSIVFGDAYQMGDVDGNLYRAQCACILCNHNAI